MVYIDIDKEILYWIDQYGFKPKSTGKLIDYIKENWIVNQRELVERYVEVMEIKVPTIDILDWDRISEMDNDYKELGNGKFLNVYEIETNDIELKRLDLIE